MGKFVKKRTVVAISKVLSEILLKCALGSYFLPFAIENHKLFTPVANSRWVQVNGL
jgi:hypothetical protein